jgi:hypothetical protein
MNSVLMLLALSAAVGFVLGTALTWYAILMSRSLRSFPRRCCTTQALAQLQELESSRLA